MSSIKEHVSPTVPANKQQWMRPIHATNTGFEGRAAKADGRISEYSGHIKLYENTFHLII